MNTKKIKDALCGFVVGDMIGVPYEFTSACKPEEVFLKSGGVHDQPLGAWSDDTALSLATIEWLNTDRDIVKLRKEFKAWFHDAKYTSHLCVFDVGEATKHGILGNYDALDEDTQGNGSLMRIWPLAFIRDEYTEEEFSQLVKDVAYITHPSEYTTAYCMKYLDLMQAILKDEDVSPWLNNKSTMKQEEIENSGWIKHTYNAALWFYIHSGSYEECIKRAVAIGGDTDTRAALAGCLYSLKNGSECIPSEWLGQINGNRIINDILNRFQ
jgi:ADP-ribosyl-[dinitrogen reductase] hydrolase